MATARNRVLYQFRVTLRDIRPPIWRCIQVWEDATLFHLHAALQIVMGWEDSHLHEFRIGRKIYGTPDLDDERTILDVKQTRIREVVGRVGTELEYLYDFGDNWQHTLMLEAVLRSDPNIPYPKCIAGERNCPPEDVGGAGGYQTYLAALADPGNEEHDHNLAWNGPFDPEAFSLSVVNQQLQKKFRSRRLSPVPGATGQITPTASVGPGKATRATPLLEAFAIPPRDGIRIRRDEKVALKLNDRERELIQWHTFADRTLTNRLRVAPMPGDTPVFRFTVDDLHELADFLASEANHAKNKRLQKEWMQLCGRVEAALEGYTDEGD